MKINPSCENILRRIFSGAILVIWIIVPYALLQQFSIREIWWLEPTAVDKSIPLNYYALWPYYTFYLLLAIVGLHTERSIYLCFLYTIGWSTMVAHMIFFLFPNGLARLEIMSSEPPIFYQWLIKYDLPRNVFPSLHVTLAVIAGIAVYKSKRFNLLSKFAIYIWILSIIWSTVSLRQHVLIDCIAGIGIAVVVWVVVAKMYRIDSETLKEF